MTTTDQRRCLVTGANRGLGLEFARQLSAAGAYGIGACRSPDSAHDLRAVLREGSGLLVQLDVTDDASVTRCEQQVAGDIDALDLLINNAGVDDVPGSAGPLDTLEASALMAVLTVNIIGPALVTRAFTPLLTRSDHAVIVNLTARRGLIDAPMPSGHIGYAISKAGLNMLTAKLAAELGDQGVTVVAISPGWVQTDMGGADAPRTAEESVTSMLHVIERLRPSDSAAILAHDGTPLSSRSVPSDSPTTS